MELKVKLEAFEGPLDLLLHLIDKNKVNIYDIPIVEITKQYLEYLDEMKTENLDVMSEFLVMASTLIAIKSKMLLPPELDEEGEEIDPRAELVEQLLEYKMYKYMSYELRDRQVDAEKIWYKKPTLPKEVAEFQLPVDMDKLCEGVQLSDLHNIFKSIMKKQVDKVDTVHANFGKIEKEQISLPDKMNYLSHYAVNHSRFSFRSLLESQSGKMEIVVTFLAVLELIKVGDLVVSQEKLFDDIQIISKVAA